MSDTPTPWLLAGIGIGLSLGIGAVILYRQQAGGSGTFTTHEVHRDEEGRIKAVESIENVQLGGQAGVQRPFVVASDE